ncbi:MAG: hypothetical protein ACRCZD_12615 [Phycicoccus sp.]
MPTPTPQEEGNTPMTLTDAMLDALCGCPEMTFEERVLDDARSMNARLIYTGAVT